MVQSTISRSLSIAMLVFQRVVNVTRWSWSGNLLKISKHWRSQRIPDGLKMDKVMQSIFGYGWDCNASGDEKWFLKKCMYSYGEKNMLTPGQKMRRLKVSQCRNANFGALGSAVQTGLCASLSAEARLHIDAHRRHRLQQFCEKAPWWMSGSPEPFETGVEKVRFFDSARM